MYYLINDNPDRRFETKEEVVNEVVTSEAIVDCLYEHFDAYLDEEGQIEICGYRFSPSEVLYKVAEEYYYAERDNWAENEVEYYQEQYIAELERAEPGETVSILNEYIYVYDEADEDNTEDIEIFIEGDLNSSDTGGENFNPISLLRRKLQIIRKNNESKIEIKNIEAEEYLQLLTS